MFEIIPAIDILEGRCVRLEKGEFDKRTIYDNDPVHVARDFEAAGFRRLHLVDLDGARQGRPVNLNVLEQICRQTRLHVDFGGGVKEDRDVHMVLACGAKQVTAGTIAVQQPEMVLRWMEKFGKEAVILGADVKDGFIATSGWQDTSHLHYINFITPFYEAGVRTIISTDISRDGMLSGPSVQLYLDIKQHFPEMQIIASGGITSTQDLIDLKLIGCTGAIVGKAFYEGRLSLEDALSITA